MNEKPILSIVTPTTGKYSEYWQEQLVKVKGEIQFILVYPPGAEIKPINDSRVKNLISPYKGETIQRIIGLLNASGEYVLSLDDDDYLHPDVLSLITEYFKIYPNSWILRLKKAEIDFQNKERIKQDWESIPDVNQLEICKKTPENPYPYQQGKYQGLLEVPIAPLDKKFDLRYAVWPLMERKDNFGYHFENFNNVVWKNKLVKEALQDLSQAMKIGGALTWIPFWGIDRLLGLFVQAKFYDKDAIIGHWMPNPEQVRYIDKPPALKPPRIHVIADALLVKSFPQYGYFWNLFFNKLYGVPRVLGKAAKWKLLKK